MEIIIREPNKYNRRTGWFNNQARNDTITDAKLYNENTLVTANREASKLYLVQFSLSPSYMKILDSVDLIYDNTPQHIDLLTIHKDTVYFVALSNTICTVKIVDNKLIKDKIYYLPAECCFHGLTFDPENDDIVYLAGAGDMKLTKYSFSENKILKRESLEGMKGHILKQCKFLHNNQYFVVSSTTGGVSKDNHHHKYFGCIAIFKVSDWSLVHILNLGYVHLDDLCVENDIVYLTYQDSNQGKIITFTFENNKLVRNSKEYIVKGFPHGVDVSNGILVAGCLQSSSVCAMKV